MIKAVFFDFYNTLVRFWPPVEEIQVAACDELGISVDKESVRQGYTVADDFFNRENARHSLARRSPERRSRFFAEYEQRILRGAGLEVTLDLAQQIWDMTTRIPKDFALFDDVVPALKALKKRGYKLGVLSNLNRDMGPLVQRLALDRYLDFCITSQEAGAEKPHPPIFLAALARAGVAPQEAAHVGDQYHSDVEGARGVGMIPLLLDRDDRHGGHNDCWRIRSLTEIDALLLAKQPESSDG